MLSKVTKNHLNLQNIYNVLSKSKTKICENLRFCGKKIMNFFVKNWF